MENAYEPLQHQKQDFSSSPSLFPPNSNNPESTSSTQPPPYPNPSQYPPHSGINYTQQYPPPNPAVGYPQPQQYPPPTGMPFTQQYPPQNPVVGYPQPYGLPPGGQPYYLQPGVVYPGAPSPNYQAPNPQQQQQCVIINNQQIGGQPVAVVGAPSVSMTGAIVLSCFAFWCFGWVFGLIAFILAIVGQSSAAAGDIPGAIRLRNASYGVSIAGIVVGIIIIIVVASVVGSAARKSTYYYCSNYYSYGTYYYSCK